MLCTCSGERYQFEDRPQSPESLATRDFSLRGSLSSRTGGDWEDSNKLDDTQVDEVESALRETLSLNYEEARALLGRLEYQKGNFDAALHVFEGIDVKGLKSRMIRAIAERTRPRRGRGRGEGLSMSVMSLHSVALLIEAIFLKSRSLEGLRRFKDAALECKTIIDIIESAWPHGVPEGTGEDCKLKEMLHRALELLPELWKQAGHLDEAISAYRRALLKPWNLDPKRQANLQKDLAASLLYGGLEVILPSEIQQLWGYTKSPTNIEEALLLLLILMTKVSCQEISWDPEIMNHLMYALSLSGHFELLGSHIEQLLPGTYSRIYRWYVLGLCYSAGGFDNVALNLIRKTVGRSEKRHRAHLPSLLFGAKLCSKSPSHSSEGLKFAEKAVEVATNQEQHLVGVASHLLGLCCGCSARSSISDSQRVKLQQESLMLMQNAMKYEKDNPELVYSIAKENAIQRNLSVAIEYMSRYVDLVAGSSVSGWKLLILVASAEQNIKAAEQIVDLAIVESGKVDQLDFLRLKALLQILQEMPKDAIETYRILLSMIQAQKFQMLRTNFEVKFEKNVEMETWLDLAKVYMKLGSWNDSHVCLDKAKSVDLFAANTWHVKGLILDAESSQNEALISCFISLSIQPNHVPSMVLMASILRNLGGKSMGIARSLLMNALRIESTNHEAWLNLGYIAKFEGLLHQAADCFQAAYELRQSSPVQNFI